MVRLDIAPILLLLLRMDACTLHAIQRSGSDREQHV